MVISPTMCARVFVGVSGDQCGYHRAIESAVDAAHHHIRGARRNDSSSRLRYGQRWPICDGFIRRNDQGLGHERIRGDCDVFCTTRTKGRRPPVVLGLRRHHHLRLVRRQVIKSST